jgi:nitrite reductase (NADH) large subunit
MTGFQMTTAWKCDLCGYVHNGPEAPQSCPVCGADVSHFSALEIRTSAAQKTLTEAWQCSICDHIEPGSSPPNFCPICGAAAALFHPYVAPETSTNPASINKLVILGAGIAGMTAAEEARRQASTVEITLVSRELSLPYFRLNLTRFLAGEVEEDDLLIQHQEWFDAQKITYLSGEAQFIDRDARKVMLRDGKQLDYDRLIMANGAHPFIPPIPGTNRDGVMVLRTLEHARKMISSLTPGCRAVCIGGGLLGLETAWALKQRGAEVTVLEGFDWLLPRQLPPAAAALLFTHLEKQQMTIKCGVQVQEFTGDETVRGVLLEDGTEIPAELVILATGVRPNSHLARQCGLKVKQGVVVNDHLFTSDEHILAAGDVSEHQGKVYGIWPASYAQGLVAGAIAVGASGEFPGLPMTNRIKVLDVDLFSIGQIQAIDASTRLLGVEENGSYRGLACHDGQVVGAVLYGDMQLIGLLQDAVEKGRRIQEVPELWKYFPGLQQMAG